LDLRVAIAGEALLLMPEHVAAWPARATLLVADAHFGKAASFRAAGIPVPRGTTGDDLARLDTARARAKARRVVFLGDFLHSRQARAPATLAAIARWRDAHRDIEMVVVRGNHDRQAGDPPPDLGIRSVAEPLAEGPFLLCHHPEPRPGGYVLAGHLHPAIRLGGSARQSLRLDCFHFAPAVGVLPAFGSFTGRALVRPGRDDRVYVVAGEIVVEVPSRPASAPRAEGAGARG
jgi:DNA ligase-associated metallophosphoesterase